MNMTIVTIHINPPIPIRDFDWVSYRACDEECGPYGHGPTEAAAIKALKDHEDE